MVVIPYRRFGTTYWSHLQGSFGNQEENRSRALPVIATKIATKEIKSISTEPDKNLQIINKTPTTKIKYPKNYRQQSHITKFPPTKSHHQNTAKKVTSPNYHQQSHITKLLSTKPHHQITINKVTSPNYHQQSHITKLPSTKSHHQITVNEVTSPNYCQQSHITKLPSTM